MQTTALVAPIAVPAPPPSLFHCTTIFDHMKPLLVRTNVKQTVQNLVCMVGV